MFDKKKSIQFMFQDAIRNSSMSSSSYALLGPRDLFKNLMKSRYTVKDLIQPTVAENTFTMFGASTASNRQEVDRPKKKESTSVTCAKCVATL